MEYAAAMCPCIPFCMLCKLDAGLPYAVSTDLSIFFIFLSIFFCDVDAFFYVNNLFAITKHLFVLWIKLFRNVDLFVRDIHILLFIHF